MQVYKVLFTQHGQTFNLGQFTDYDQLHTILANNGESDDVIMGHFIPKFAELDGVNRAYSDHGYYIGRHFGYLLNR